MYVEFGTLPTITSSMLKENPVKMLEIKLVCDYYGLPCSQTTWIYFIFATIVWTSQPEEFGVLNTTDYCSGGFYLVGHLKSISGDAKGLIPVKAIPRVGAIKCIILIFPIITSFSSSLIKKPSCGTSSANFILEPSMQIMIAVSPVAMVAAVLAIVHLGIFIPMRSNAEMANL